MSSNQQRDRDQLTATTDQGKIELKEEDLNRVVAGAMKTYLKTPDITPIGSQF